jgi:hypothetical protein
MIEVHHKRRSIMGQDSLHPLYIMTHISKDYETLNHAAHTPRVGDRKVKWSLIVEQSLRWSEPRQDPDWCDINNCVFISVTICSSSSYWAKPCRRSETGCVSFFNVLRSRLVYDVSPRGPSNSPDLDFVLQVIPSLGAIRAIDVIQRLVPEINAEQFVGFIWRFFPERKVRQNIGPMWKLFPELSHI